MSTHRTQPRRSQPTGVQLLGRRLRGRRAHVHGDFGHDDHERGPAVHRRRSVRRADRRRLGDHELSGRQRHRPADHRLAVGTPRPPQILPAIHRRLHASPRRCAAWPTSLEQMILFRVIQGLAGGGLQPCSQGVLLDAFPPEKQGTAMTLFGVAAIIAPIVGPTLGGWILRQLRLAVDLPHQRPDRPVVPGRRVRSWSTTPNTSSRSGPS